MRISDWSSDVCSSDLGLIAHRIDHLCRTADRDAALRQIDVAAKSARTRAVTMAGNGGAGGHQQTRTGDHAVVDRALDIDIGVTGAFSTQIAQRGEAGDRKSVV